MAKPSDVNNLISSYQSEQADIQNYQELFVKKVESDYRIIIGNQAGSAVNCDYVVFGERKDTGKNIPEYEGQTPKDYPGDNDQYSIAGYHYDRRTL